MNHLLITQPHDPLLMKAAKKYFKCTPKIIKQVNTTVAFFPDKNALFSEPMDKTFLCGTIYNPRELPQLLRQQSYKGIDGLFVIAKVTKDQVHLINDRFGFHPLYVYKFKKKKVYCTSLDFLALHVQYKSINWNAWADLFQYSMCFENTTQFNEINIVDYAQHMVLGKQSSQKRYTDYMAIKPKKSAQAVDRVHKALKQTTKQILEFKLNIAIPLSAGTDSRILASAFAEHTLPHCFSTGKDLGKLGRGS